MVETAVARIRMAVMVIEAISAVVVDHASSDTPPQSGGALRLASRGAK